MTAAGRACSSLTRQGPSNKMRADRTHTKLTHTHTIQLLLNMNGCLIAKLYVNLRESEGQFGQLLNVTMPRNSNWHVICSESGKHLARRCVETGVKDVVDNLHDNRCFIYFDSWSVHRTGASPAPGQECRWNFPRTLLTSPGGTPSLLLRP